MLKRFSRSLFVLLALATAMGTMTFGCAKSDDDTKPAAPPAADSPVKSGGGTGAAPPKTHD